MFLRDYPNHLKALFFARRIAPEKPYIFETFYYFLKLHQLEPSAVRVSLPDERNFSDHKIFVLYLYPFEADDYEDSQLPADVKLQLDVIEINLKTPMIQKQAADYCSVSVRTLQRWEKDGLSSIKIGRNKIYDEEDLIAFMNDIGHMRGLKRCGTSGYWEDWQKILTS